MGFSLGSFAGGAAEGIESGVNIAGKLHALQEAARVRAARAALGRSYMAEPPMGDGATVPPVTPPMPGVASLPRGDTNPDPMMTNGPPANDMSGIPANGAPPPPPQALPPPIAPGAPPPNLPATADAPATGGGGVPLSGTAAPVQQAGPQDEHAAVASSITDANNTIRSIAHAIKQANPKIDPETLFEATRQHIENMKGVRNEVKDYMVAQTEMAKIQQRVLTTGMKINGNEDVARIRAASAETVGAGHDAARRDSAVIAGDSRRDVAKIGAGARVTAAQINQQGGVTREQIRANSNEIIQDAHDKTRAYVAELGGYVKVLDSNTGAEARVDAETARAGGTPPERKRLNPLPMPTKPGAYLDRNGKPVGGSGATPTAGTPPKELLKEGVVTRFTGKPGGWTLRAGVPTRVP